MIGSRVSSRFRLFCWLIPLFVAPAASAQADPPGWASHDISTTTVKAFAVWPADVDGDGDLDVFSTGLNDTIAWHENVEGSGDLWIEHFMATAEFAFSAYAVDVNGDGAMDLVVGSTSATDSLVWFENRFGDGSGWIRRVVPFSPSTARDVHAADVDADGDIDLLSALEDKDQIVFSRNLDGNGTSWSSDVVGTGGTPISVDVADMDGNGTLDVLAVYSAETRVSWYSNTDGSGSAWVEHDILEVPGVGGHSVFPADIDDDGDMDALSASFANNQLVFNGNVNGLGTDWVGSVIPTAIGNYISVIAADLDLDGDLDAVTSSFDQSLVDASPIAWQENLTGDGSSWLEHEVSATPAKARAAVVADIDGDCDPDIVAATSTNDRIAWFESLLPDADCNSNGISDACDIASGSSLDCNGNGIPDECDLVIDPFGDGLSFGLGGIDARPWTAIGGPNGIPDACEFPILRDLLMAVPEDRGTAVRRQGSPPGGRDGGLVARDERLAVQVEGGAGATDALVYATWLGSVDRPTVMPDHTLVAAVKVALDGRGRARAELSLAQLPASAGTGDILSVRAVFLAENGRPLRSSGFLDVLLVDAPRLRELPSPSPAR